MDESEHKDEENVVAHVLMFFQYLLSLSVLVW